MESLSKNLTVRQKPIAIRGARRLILRYQSKRSERVYEVKREFLYAKKAYVYDICVH